MLTLRDLWLQLRQQSERLWLGQALAFMGAIVAVPIPLLMPLLVDEVLLNQPGRLTQFMTWLLPQTWLGATAIMATVLFVVVERRAMEPVLPLRLFANRAFWVASVVGFVVGFALFFHNFSTFLGKRGLYLEDLFVRPAARGAGLGKHLMAALARIAVQRDCGRFEWSVLDWNAPAIGFYRSIGATGMDEWTVQRLEGAALHALAARDEL